MDLVLERKGQEDGTLLLGNEAVTVSIAPEVDEDYWEYRVRLTERQAVVGFPKFGTIGIGFAVEDEDWNTNQPWRSDVVKIREWIWRNRGDESITVEQVDEAIRLIQDAVREDRGE